MRIPAHQWLIVAISCLLVQPVMAAPAAQPGDLGLRHDIQVLADYGAISGPVTTWPISWDAVLADLEYVQAKNIVLPNKVLPTFNRILERAQREAGRGEFSYGGSLAGAEDPTQIRGFSKCARVHLHELQRRRFVHDGRTCIKEFDGEGIDSSIRDLGSWQPPPRNRTILE